MSKDPRSNRHPHLNREAIAHTALQIIDREGAGGLSLRRVAGELGVGTMSLYHYVPSREVMIADVCALLLGEMDLTVRPGFSWPDGARQVARTMRAMALRHPRAFELLAAAASDKPPLLDFARRLRAFYTALGAPLDAFVEVWSVLDAFETGFLLLETKARLREAEARSGGLDEETNRLADSLPASLTEAAYEEGLDIILDGLERRLGARRRTAGHVRLPGAPS